MFGDGKSNIRQRFTFELNESKKVTLKASTELKGVRCGAMQMLCEEAKRPHREVSYA